MTRYSNEFKLKVVQYYNDHPEFGYLSVAREFNIPSDETVRNWIKLYQAHGEEGFVRKVFKPHPKHSSWMDPKTAQERIAYLEAENAYLKKLAELRGGD